MNKLLSIVFSIVAMSFALTAVAEKPAHPEQAAGPEPQIRVQTFCYKKDGTEASPFSKYLGEGSPNMKNDFLSAAIAEADDQIAGTSPRNAKGYCFVEFENAAGNVRIVYEAFED